MNSLNRGWRKLVIDFECKIQIKLLISFISVVTLKFYVLQLLLHSYACCKVLNAILFFF